VTLTASNSGPVIAGPHPSQGDDMSSKVRARALVGFYRGDLVQPGEVLELDMREFQELASFGKVERLPDEPPAEEAPAARGRRRTE
jgi:hypothetical protein